MIVARMILPAADLTPSAQPADKLPVDPAALRAQFDGLVTELTASDAKLTEMVTAGSKVGTGWGPHLSGFAHRFLAARDGLREALPAEVDLVGKLAKDVVLLAEAAGNLSIIARHSSKLSVGWETFLDTAIADAKAAVALLQSTPPPVVPVDPPKMPSGPTKPSTPVSVLEPAVRSDVLQAVELIQQSVVGIQSLPSTDAGTDATKQARIAAFNLNKQAQDKLELHMAQTTPEAVLSGLRNADARLEDAAWQLAKKASPDGRFNGVDIPGALRDSLSAIELLDGLTGPTIDSSRP